MSQKIAVFNPESESDNVEVRGHSAHCANQPHPLRNLWPIEAGRYPECRHRV